MYDLIKNSEDLLSKEEIYINTSKGKLSVFNRIKNEDAVFISAPKPVFLDKTIQSSEIAKALRIETSNINGNSPVAIVNAGLETLIVPIRSLDDILSITPDWEELKKFCIKQAIDIITVFSEEVANKCNAFRTRVFAPIFGYLEDPATGSGNSAFGYYLLKNGRWQNNIMSIEQNSFFDNPNIVKLEFSADEHGEAQVSFGGSAVVRIIGEYYLV